MKTTTTKHKQPNKQEAIKHIARHILGFETLDTRMSDSLDFKEVSVWSVKSALEYAYLAGQRNAEQVIDAFTLLGKPDDQAEELKLFYADESPQSLTAQGRHHAAHALMLAEQTMRNKGLA